MSHFTANILRAPYLRHVLRNKQNVDADWWWYFLLFYFILFYRFWWSANITRKGSKDFIWRCYDVRSKKNGDLCKNKIKRNEFSFDFQNLRNKRCTEAHQWFFNEFSTSFGNTGQKLLSFFLLKSNLNFIFSAFCVSHFNLHH